MVTQPVKKFGRYEILEEIGRGGMATLYHAYDPRFKRHVAVKVLPREFLHDPTFLERFEREAHIIGTLEHPAIVPVHDFGEEDGQPYLVMRYMEGGSLEERIKEHGALSLTEATKILARIGAALDTAHNRGFIHRDLKPANILFDEFGEAYLTDFGIAKISEATSSITGSAIIGTPAYMSPEMVHGDEDVSASTDIYALGIILYQMLTGKLPYRAETPVKQLFMHVNEPVPSILSDNANLPNDTDRIIKRAMAKSPDERFQHANEIVAELGTLIDYPAPELQKTELEMPPLEPTKKVLEVPSPISEAAVVDSTVGVTRAAPRKTRAIPWGWIIGCGVIGIGILTIAIVGFWFGSDWIVALLFGTPTPTFTVTPSATPTPTYTPTPEWTLTPTPTATQEYLFADDFSDPNSGWAQVEAGNRTTDYYNGAYRILVNVTNADYESTPGYQFTDVLIDVDATKIGGPDDNDFGVICRYTDSRNFYFFLISSDGFYGIAKATNGSRNLIGLDFMPASTAIHQGEATNHIRAECVGNQLRLIVNDVLLYEVQDNDHTTGDVGLIAGTFDIPGTDILFDDFFVRSP